MLRNLIIVLLFALPLHTLAQSGISGAVFDYENKSFPLQKVAVRNLSNQKSTVTGAAGQFNIQAKKGDLLEFSFQGYHTDTLYLTDLQSKTIYLPSQAKDLKEVKIQSAKLSRDLNLNNPTNAAPVKRVNGIPPKQNIGRAGGVALTFGTNKGKRQQAKVRVLEENSAYEDEIRENFDPEYITKLTKLQGEELKDFMGLYRPSVARVRNEAPFDYDLYIATSYQAWLKLPPERRKLPPIQKLKSN